MSPIYNPPNLLTLLRIVLIPVFVACFYLPYGWSGEAATAIFLLAALTDWLDGYLARRMQLVSALGAFLDPVADKLMVATALILLVQADPRMLLAIAAAVIIGREIAISGLREWMAEIGSRTAVAVSEIGKFKTAAQMAAISLLIYRDDLWGMPIYTIGLVLLAVAVVLTLWSMTLYIRAAWPSLRGEKTPARLPGDSDSQG
jgi:CDP-diacylglycerol--glycerol-3-phosphate 3-phosphatidyltransferase/cardiolipin synthase